MAMGLTDRLFRKHEWNDLLEKLKNKELPSSKIGPAIVKLGKPFDEKKILAAKDVVAGYLNHKDSWVRREAMWFLTSWGRLPEYRPALIRALREDPDLDNRAYAASSLGILDKGNKNPETIKALRAVLEDDQQDELVRKYAYRSLLEVVKNNPVTDFDPNDKRLADVDWTWVKSLSKNSGDIHDK